MTVRRPDYDFVVVGGGFYGCCTALFLRSISDRVLIIEAGDALLERASRVNQARIHTGFHYPRSFVTALRSMALHQAFARDFPDAIVDDFQMLYAIARRRSKVSARRFFNMYQNMNAPIALADRARSGLFNETTTEAVFACREWAFDYRSLRAQLFDRLEALGVGIVYGSTVKRMDHRRDRVWIESATGSTRSAKYAFNVTYAEINHVLAASGLHDVPIKHELAEIALVAPPPELSGYGVTVMDGPFFSMMPYPAEHLYSLTHVRYTPHASWLDKSTANGPYAHALQLPRQSRSRHMIMDAQRYLPCVENAVWQNSLYEVKSVLIKNERDDGRPILFHRQENAPRIISIMGGKIDNIYDLFDALRESDPAWRRADTRHLHGQLGKARVAG